MNTYLLWWEGPNQDKHFIVGEREQLIDIALTLDDIGQARIWVIEHNYDPTKPRTKYLPQALDDSE